jgi:DNA polymerase III delta prime subunit
MDDFLWVEKYRPHTVGECVLPERLKLPFQTYVNDKKIPNMILTGSPGVGKTTIALAMCEEMGVNHMVINGSRERGIDTLRTKIVNYASTISLTGGQKVIIIDEADYLTPDAQAAMRGTIEEFINNCTFILTCNFKSKLIEAIHSRCPPQDFKLEKEEKPKMAMEMFKKLEFILKTEGVSYEKPVLVKIVEKYFPDYRRTINELQHLATSGSIDSSALARVANIGKLKDLYGFLRDKKFTVMRKWVVDNSDVDTTTVFRAIFDSLVDYLEPSSVPQAVLILSKYQYQSAFVSDQEMNLVACLTEMMVDCEYTAF